MLTSEAQCFAVQMTFIVAARLFLGVGIALYGGLLLYQNRAQAVEQEHVFNRQAMLCIRGQAGGCAHGKLTAIHPADHLWTSGPSRTVVVWRTGESCAMMLAGCHKSPPLLHALNNVSAVPSRSMLMLCTLVPG